MRLRPSGRVGRLPVPPVSVVSRRGARVPPRAGPSGPRPGSHAPLEVVAKTMLSGPTRASSVASLRCGCPRAGTAPPREERGARAQAPDVAQAARRPETGLPVSDRRFPSARRAACWNPGSIPRPDNRACWLSAPGCVGGACPPCPRARGRRPRIARERDLRRCRSSGRPGHAQAPRRLPGIRRRILLAAARTCASTTPQRGLRLLAKRAQERDLGPVGRPGPPRRRRPPSSSAVHPPAPCR